FLHQSRNWLHDPSYYYWHPSSHTALKTAQSVGRTIISPFLIPSNLIMVLTSKNLCSLETNTKFNTFKSINTCYTTRNSCVELTIIMNIRSYPSWHTFHIDFTDTAKRVSLAFCQVDFCHHLFFS